MHEPDSPNTAQSPFFPEPLHTSAPPLRIKLPPISGMELRRSNRRASASGSEYHASEKSVDMDADAAGDADEDDEEPPVQYDTTRSGRRIVKKQYIESSDGELDEEPDTVESAHFDGANVGRATRVSSRRQPRQDSADDDDDGALRRSQRKRVKHLEGFIEPDEGSMDEGTYGAPRRLTRASSRTNGKASKPKKVPQRPSRITRRSVRAVEDDFHPEQTTSGASDDADGSLDDVPVSDLEPEPEPEPEPEEEPEDGRPYALRQRQKVNYAIPPPLEDLPKPPPKQNGGRNGGKNGANGRGKGRSLGWSASGAELGRWMGMPADDSVINFFHLYFRHSYSFSRTLTTQHEHHASLLVALRHSDQESYPLGA